MDKNKTAPVIGTFVDALVKVLESGKLAIAKELHKAQKAGFKPSQIAREWKKVSGEDALGDDAISKYLLAYSAHLKGANFQTVLKGLNATDASKRLSREMVANLSEENIPEELAQKPETNGNGGGRGDSDPIAKTKKDLAALVERVKADKLPSRDAIKFLNDAIADIQKLASVTGNAHRAA